MTGLAETIPIANQSAGNLSQAHLKELRASGLNDATIRASGLYTERDAGAIAKMVKWKTYKGQHGAALVFPFFSAAGHRLFDYSRLKFERPRTSRENKIIKYESPKGAANRAYLPPGITDTLQDVSCPIFTTEGEKKSLKATQEGIPTVGLVGVYGWQKKRAKGADGKPTGERELIPDLATIPWQGRHVYIVFDSDAVTNPNVRWAEFHLAEALTRRGAIVRIVRLPPGPVGADGKPLKNGLDDFLVAHSVDEFRALADRAEIPQAPAAALKSIEAPDDPHRLARLVIAERYRHADGMTLRHYRDEAHQWDGAVYRVIPDGELRAELTATVKAEMDSLNIAAQERTGNEDGSTFARKVTGRLVADVSHALASLTVLPSRIEAPAWLDGAGPFPAGEILACQNGLIHLPSLVAGKQHFAPPTPRFFSPNCLDFHFLMDAPTPSAWLDFLALLWPDDGQSVGTLQEWFGYCLTPDTSQQKILLAVGPKRSGKGTIARVLAALIGKANIAGPTLSSLGTNFGAWPLLGKSLAIISDARLSGRSDTSAVIERLLSISGEDAITIDRKNLQPITTKLPTRFVILTNELPRLGDASGALAGRMILLRLKQSWYGREDTGLTDRLTRELPGILLWAIDGWRRLRERGRFEQPDASREMIGELDDLGSPVGAFVRDCCNIGPGLQIERSALFAAWKQWCEVQGREHPGDAATFGRNLHAVVPALGDGQRRTDGGRIRVYEGITLK